MRRTLILLAVAALAGCGGDDDENGEETGAAGGGETIAISLVDFRLEPATVQLDAAGTYTFRATNDGDTQHALEIEGGDVEEETETLDPGDTGEVTVELAAGEYELYCPIDDHRDQGMEGDLTVGGGSVGTDTGETETDDD
jgi:plastocyanin